MKTGIRKALESWQISDATRLKQLFESHSKLSQEQFGAEYDLGSQGVVWQYLNAHIPLNLAAALKFARGLGVRIADFSPTLAADLGDANHSEANTVGQIFDGLPDNEKQEALDFIRYKFERAEGVIASEKTAHYMTMIERIQKDMARRLSTETKKRRR